MKITRTLLRSLYIVLNFVEMIIFSILAIPLYIISLILTIPYALFYYVKKHRIIVGICLLLAMMGIMFNAQLHETYNMSIIELIMRIKKSGQSEMLISESCKAIINLYKTAPKEIYALIFAFLFIIIGFGICTTYIFELFKSLRDGVLDKFVDIKCDVYYYFDEIRKSFNVITYGSEKEIFQREIQEFKEKYGPFGKQTV